MVDIVIGVVIAAAVAAIIIKKTKDLKEGKSSCSCGCQGCSGGCAGCSTEEKQ